MTGNLRGINQVHTNESYSDTGYQHYGNVFHEEELNPIRVILSDFHEKWVADNNEFYKSRAVNSAYITRPTYLDPVERLKLFKFITDTKIMGPLKNIIPNGSVFMGTQLFFNPSDPQRKNYWHRDMQYNREPIEKQQANLKVQIPLHVRIALRDEPGIELIKGTHARWDTPQEYAVRMEENGHSNHEDLPNSVIIPMKAGDILIFSANMIHRGLYGMDRFAFDLLFTDQNPDILKFIDPACLPDKDMLNEIQNQAPYVRALNAINALN